MFGIGINLFTSTVGVEQQIPPYWNQFINSNFLLYLENGTDLILEENATDILIQESNILLYLENVFVNFFVRHENFLE